MQDADGSVPFFWGADSEDNLVLSDDVQILQQACGKSFAPFPKGDFLFWYIGKAKVTVFQVIVGSTAIYVIYRNLFRGALFEANKIQNKKP